MAGFDEHEPPMRNLARLLIRHSPYVASTLALLISPGPLCGQASESPSTSAGNDPEPLNWTAQQDHKNMMGQLGITRLRPGPSGQPGATNSAVDAKKVGIEGVSR
jgi:hypothetical protein